MLLLEIRSCAVFEEKSLKDFVHIERLRDGRSSHAYYLTIMVSYGPLL